MVLGTTTRWLVLVAQPALPSPNPVVTRVHHGLKPTCVFLGLHPCVLRIGLRIGVISYILGASPGPGGSGTVTLSWLFCSRHEYTIDVFIVLQFFS